MSLYVYMGWWNLAWAQLGQLCTLIKGGVLILRVIFLTVAKYGVLIERNILIDFNALTVNFSVNVTAGTTIS